ncbi:hypothetical protein CEXT_497111 [Caerostris extrusa]|uniref:Uncharacterized protein n=1 Tax=Caerostris extrusa TaxID=172846 RepID=A0AAV4V219_CAEEX|nr:hypothetical protein CEXT_497111 [Caerostris extrusa]
MPHPTASIRHTFLNYFPNFSFKAFHPHPITHISNLTLPFFSIPSHQASSFDTLLESQEKMSPSPDDSIVFARVPGQESESPKANPQHGDESFANRDSPVYSFRMSQSVIWEISIVRASILDLFYL